MKKLTGGEAVVKSLVKHDIDTVFCLPGVQNDYFFNALYDEIEGGAEIEVIHTRHEQGAAYMALGYTLSTGKVGLYSVVPGAGFLNTTCALSTGLSTNAKLFCLTGEVPTPFIGRGFGQLHEIPDQLGVMRSLTKWAAHVATPAEAPGLIAEAFRQLQSDRPRPIGLQVPMDVLSSKMMVDLDVEAAAPYKPPVDLDLLEQAAERLGKAKRPLIFVGGGALDASEEITQLAEMLQAPVVAHQMGRGVVDGRNYLSQFALGGYLEWEKADAILAIGTRMMMPLGRWRLDGTDRLININIDPEAFTRAGVRGALNIVGDAQDAAGALVELVGKHNIKRSSREAELLGLKAKVKSITDRLGPQTMYTGIIRDVLPEDGIFVDEVTQIGFASRMMMPTYAPRKAIGPGYQGTLGYGYATALGVKVANRDKPVVQVSGDGGLLFTIQEMATAVQHKIGLTTIVFNDGAYGNVRRMQKNDHGGRFIASDLQNPDFVKMADSFGAQGLRANSPEELKACLEEGLSNNDVPTLIDVPVGEFPSPWAMLMNPKSVVD